MIPQAAGSEAAASWALGLCPCVVAMSVVAVPMVHARSTDVVLELTDLQMPTPLSECNPSLEIWAIRRRLLSGGAWSLACVRTQLASVGKVELNFIRLFFFLTVGLTFPDL